MLGENIKVLRKNKGLTQEQLAVKLNVVRQTVSKWEKNLSVPDAETVTKIAETLDVSVSDLLDTLPNEEKELNDIAMQLQNLNDLLAMQAKKQRDIIKKVKIGVVILLLVLFVAAIYPEWNDIWYEFGKKLYRFIHS